MNRRPASVSAQRQSSSKRTALKGKKPEKLIDRSGPITYDRIIRPVEWKANNPSGACGRTLLSHPTFKLQRAINNKNHAILREIVRELVHAGHDPKIDLKEDQELGDAFKREVLRLASGRLLPMVFNGVTIRWKKIDIWEKVLEHRRFIRLNPKTLRVRINLDEEIPDAEGEYEEGEEDDPAEEEEAPSPAPAPAPATSSSIGEANSSSSSNSALLLQLLQTIPEHELAAILAARNIT